MFATIFTGVVIMFIGFLGYNGVFKRMFGYAVNEILLYTFTLTSSIYFGYHLFAIIKAIKGG